jgi:hypothetical protein
MRVGESEDGRIKEGGMVAVGRGAGGSEQRQTRQLNDETTGGEKIRFEVSQTQMQVGRFAVAPKVVRREEERRTRAWA